MSAPLVEEKRAEYIDLSFLAALTVLALNATLAGEDLDSEGKRVLPRAVDFLQDISRGVAFVSSGNVPQGFDAVRAVDALDFAMAPMEHLQQLVIDKDIAVYFDDVASALAQSQEAAHLPTEDERARLQFAKEFFAELHSSLSRLLDHPRERDFAFDSKGFNLAA